MQVFILSQMKTYLAISRKNGLLAKPAVSLDKPKQISQTGLCGFRQRSVQRRSFPHNLLLGLLQYKTSYSKYYHMNAPNMIFTIYAPFTTNVLQMLYFFVVMCRCHVYIRLQRQVSLAPSCGPSCVVFHLSGRWRNCYQPIHNPKLPNQLHVLNKLCIYYIINT